MKRSYTFYIRLAALTLCGALMVSVTTGCCFCLPASVKDKININLPIGTQTTTRQNDAAVQIPDSEMPEDSEREETDVPVTAPSADAPATTTTTAVQQEALVMYVVAKDGLRMREQPYLDAAVILSIPHESQVLVLKEQDDWYYVQYKTAEGWCSVDWIFPSIESASTEPQAKGDRAIVLNGIEKANDVIRSHRGATIPNGLTDPNPEDQDILDWYLDAAALYDTAMNNGLSSLFSTDDADDMYYDGYRYWSAGSIDGYRNFEALCTDYYRHLSDDLAYWCLRDEFALIDDELYGCYAGVQDGHVPYDVDYSVVRDGDRYLVIATVTYHYSESEGWDDVTEVYTNVCEYEDGNWVFTSLTALPQ